MVFQLSLSRLSRYAGNPSAYVANLTTLETIPKVLPDITYISDSENHSSIIQGISHSKAKKSKVK